MNKKLYKLMNWADIEEIIYSESDNPHRLLGPHKSGTQTLLQAFFPDAEKVRVMWKSLEDGSEQINNMEIADDDGFFAALLPEKKIGPYEYAVTYADGKKVVIGDPYRHKSLITDNDIARFENGIHYTIYEKLGAHPMTLDGDKGTYFALWAPNAMRISVVGNFNGWDGRCHQMRRLGDSGIFELFVPGVGVGEIYKYELKLKNGVTFLKSDPYGNSAQMRPDDASVVADLGGFSWDDAKFIKNREKFQNGDVPVSIYEMYLGSFAAPEESGREYANYREIAPRVIEYVQKMGYTHVELMPVMEHPLDNSWGYQVLGYYAPTSRYGSPEDFMFFVNELHKAGIGVILDWVPAHFPKNDYGLAHFDGTCLYEHLDPRQGEHPHWGTLIYNYGRPQVSNFLIANALFWVEKFHADGIRMDAVASMLYLDYGRNDGEWIPNIYGGKENLEAIEMIKHINSILKKRNPGVLSIAEESTAFPMVTGSLEDGGLGFDLKWNMGFMNDYIDYIRTDPYFRSKKHGELTFSMIYAYSEKFLLIFSHDEVVHGKATMIGKMPGEREQKFANLRLTYSYMMTHPGKKLLFMGQDLGEFDEWNERRLVQWNLLDVPEHKGIADLMRDLNKLYRSEGALYAFDDRTDGFEWLNNISGDDCYLSYVRKTDDPEEMLVVVANFAGIQQNITTGVPYEGKYLEIFNSDNKKYGGSGLINEEEIRAIDTRWDERAQSITVKLAPLSLSILKFIPYTEEELAKVIEERIRRNTPIKKSGKEKAPARKENNKETNDTKAEETSEKSKNKAGAPRSRKVSQAKGRVQEKNMSPAKKAQSSIRK